MSDNTEDSRIRTYRIDTANYLKDALEEVKDRYDGDLPNSASDSYDNLVQQMIDELEPYFESESESEVPVLEGVVDELVDTFEEYSENTDEYSDSVDQSLDYLKDLEPTESFSANEFREKINAITDDLDRYPSQDLEEVVDNSETTNRRRRDELGGFLIVVIIGYILYRVFRSIVDF